MTQTAHLRTAALALALALAGCATPRTPYEAPAVAVPTQWPHTQASARDAYSATGGWWRAFGDPVLDDLVDAALAHNNDLAAATLQVRRAQLQARLAEHRPSVNASLSTSAGRALEGSADITRANSASLGVSYELDLWGRLDAAHDAARWEADASAEDDAPDATHERHVDRRTHMCKSFYHRTLSNSRYYR